MKTEILLDKLRSVNKSFYTINDLQLITGQAKPVLRVALNRLVKNDKLNRVQKDMYTLRDEITNYELIAQQREPDSYLSFETVLSRAGILSQIPYTLTWVTKNRSKKITLDNQIIEYRRLKPVLFFGYYLEGVIRVAYPEKALLDLLYLVSRGKSDFSMDELDLSQIDKKRLRKFSQKFPEKVREISEELFKS